MLKIKESAVADMFYPGDRAELLHTINNFKAEKSTSYQTRAVIVPHAGYVYSGALAYEGLSHLNPDIKNIFIFAPAHHVYTQGAILSGYDIFRTVLGDIRVNGEISKELNEKFGLKNFETAFEKEHAIEVQLPLLQSLLDDFTIIPIIIGHDKPQNIKKIIEYYYNDEKNAFVISSDLSHFHKYQDAKKIDTVSAQMIENSDTQNFHPEQACGSTGICALSEFAKENKKSLIRLKMLNSGDVSGDKKRTVGYGSWILYDGAKNNYIKTCFSALTKEICKQSIISQGKYKPQGYPAVFDELGASFVTLEIQGNLRGCIGSIIAHRPLIEDLIKNAYASAYSDPRFAPLKEEEFDKIDIKVSLLSEPEEIKFESEIDLLNQIVPFKDGLIIKDGIHQAVYLPSVWEHLSEKVMFLDSLKQKAGLSPDYFSISLKAYKFNSEYI